MEKYYMSWDEYDLIIQKILKGIKRRYTKIFTFPRGGYIPAVHIANYLNIHEITINPLEIDSSTLIVDDISDSGKTLNIIYSPDRDIVCICYKKGTIIKPSFFSIEFENNVWVVFPWEPKESKEKEG